MIQTVQAHMFRNGNKGLIMEDMRNSVVWSGSFTGKISITRGGVTSNVKMFVDLSPEILSIEG